jgi:hypothetical protein
MIDWTRYWAATLIRAGTGDPAAYNATRTYVQSVLGYRYISPQGQIIQ